MAEIYTDRFKEQVFYSWYSTGDRSFGKFLLENLPENENGNKPNLITIQKWSEENGWIERADALDAVASVKLDEQAVDKRVKMFERLAEVGEFEVEEGFKYLKEHGIKKEETALRAISDGADLQKSAVGMADLINKMKSMTPEQLDRELAKLLGQKQENEFTEIVEGETKDMEPKDV